MTDISKLNPEAKIAEITPLIDAWFSSCIRIVEPDKVQGQDELEYIQSYLIGSLFFFHRTYSLIEKEKELLFDAIRRILISNEDINLSFGLESFKTLEEYSDALNDNNFMVCILGFIMYDYTIERIFQKLPEVSDYQTVEQPTTVTIEKTGYVLRDLLLIRRHHPEIYEEVFHQIVNEVKGVLKSLRNNAEKQFIN
tara:strand:+ start:1098 stop:1685 length:588 start_codon:yes stop_codon:yes gene_type:complete